MKERVRNHLGVVGFTFLVCFAITTGVARADSFVMPFDGFVYLQQMGGEAAGTTTFGLGTSPTNFVPFYTGLPNN